MNLTEPNLKSIAAGVDALAQDQARRNVEDEMRQTREEEMERIIEKAFTKMFAAQDDEGGDRFVNVSRVPLICQAIIGIHERLGNLEENIKWGVRLVLGAVILGVLALVFKS